MNDWKFEGWENFWEPMDEDQPEAIFLTTYTFNPNFLVEELLPNLFGMSEELKSDAWLVDMKGKLENCPVYVFCDGGKWAGTNQLNFLFLELGGKVFEVFVSNGCMHAKLWMIKFKNVIRMGIGSCNLTENGFIDQLQYVWMTEIQLSPGSVSDNSKRLIEFIRLFAKQKEDRVLQEWYNWLRIGKWPSKSWLLPCAPGKKGKHYGLGRLSKITHGKNGIKLRKNNNKYEAYLQVFCIGQMDKEWIKQFMEAMHAESLYVFWPEKTDCKDNPVLCGMILPESTQTTFSQMEETKFCKLKLTENVKFDKLLPHGKIYGLWDQGKNNGNYRYIIIGSSNFTKPAWTGCAKQGVKGNFELNIVVEQKSNVFPVDGDENKDPWISENMAEIGYESLCYMQAENKRIKNEIKLSINLWTCADNINIKYSCLQAYSSILPSNQM